MGFYVNQGAKAKCPLYESVVRSGQGRIAGVQCSYIAPGFGFNASTVIRLSNIEETLEMKALLCDDVYRACPYYQAWCMANKKKEDWSK